MRVIALLILFLSSSGVLAAPVTYYLNNVVLNDGGTVQGSFVYDSAGGGAGTISAVNIYSTVGTAFAGDFYNGEDWEIAGFGPQVLQFFTNHYPGTQINETGLVFFLDGSGYLGANQFTATVREYHCTGYCVSNNILLRETIERGTVSTVPIPAAFWLFGSALAGFGLLRRRSGDAQ